MPCLDEASFIEETLRQTLAQDYPADRFEIIVADGGSRDGTRDILSRLARLDPRIRVIDNPRRLQAAGLNEAVHRARGEVIVRMDAHAEYAPDFVRRSVEVLERTGADNAGGAARLKARTPFQRAVCAALASPLGVGGSAYRSEKNEGFVESVWNGAMRRALLQRLGGYDDRAATNEDAELNQRIIEAGGKVYLSRDIRTWYYPRDSFRGLARQYFSYGQGRARTLLKHRKLLSIRPVLPFLMLASGALLLAVSLPVALVAVAAYAGVTGLEARRVARSAGARVRTVWSIFPLLHVAHGIGFAWGLGRYLARPDWDQRPRPRSMTSGVRARISSSARR